MTSESPPSPNPNPNPNPQWQPETPTRSWCIVRLRLPPESRVGPARPFVDLDRAWCVQSGKCQWPGGGARFQVKQGAGTSQARFSSTACAALDPQLGTLWILMRPMNYRVLCTMPRLVAPGRARQHPLALPLQQPRPLPNSASQRQRFETLDTPHTA